MINLHFPLEDWQAAGTSMYWNHGNHQTIANQDELSAEFLLLK